MNRSKASSKGDSPFSFSWEKKPQITKQQSHRGDLVIKLPPPPGPIERARRSVHDIQIPLPPCAFQPPQRSGSRKGLIKNKDDPFLAAYKQCTKSSSTKKGKLSEKKSGAGWRKGMMGFSCKLSCSVVDDNLVRVSQVPYEIDRDRRIRR